MTEFHIIKTFVRHAVNTQNLYASLYILFYDSLIDTCCHTIVVTEDEGLIQTTDV